MGQRANYIIKEGDQLTIHYNHWRANCIASDLYLGETRFLEFVKECQLQEDVIPEPWIEGLVIIDKPLRQLFFWEQSDLTESSIINFYLSQLSKKWEGWTVQMMRNRMYDAEKILGIDYISNQEFQEPNSQSEEFIINDEVEKWDTAVVIIKEAESIFITRTGNLDIESIIDFGSAIIPLLRNKQQYELPKEAESVTHECIIIDTLQRKLFINNSNIGLWEQSQQRWEGYHFTMGNFGYIDTLQLAGIDAAGLAIPHQDVISRFEHLVKQRANYDPTVIAEKLMKESNDIQFNPDFFDNVHPKKTFFETIKMRLGKFFKR